MKQILFIVLMMAITGLAGCQPREKAHVMVGNDKVDELHKGPFGSCCKDLANCMNQPNALIQTNADGSLFLTIGYVRTEQGVGWFDHAVLFCPFCGARLQDRQALATKVKQ